MDYKTEKKQRRKYENTVCRILFTALVFAVIIYIMPVSIIAGENMFNYLYETGFEYLDTSFSIFYFDSYYALIPEHEFKIKSGFNYIFYSEDSITYYIPGLYLNFYQNLAGDHYNEDYYLDFTFYYVFSALFFESSFREFTNKSGSSLIFNYGSTFFSFRTEIGMKYNFNFDGESVLYGFADAETKINFLKIFILKGDFSYYGQFYSPGDLSYLLYESVIIVSGNKSNVQNKFLQGNLSLICNVLDFEIYFPMQSGITFLFFNYFADNEEDKINGLLASLYYLANEPWTNSRIYIEFGYYYIFVNQYDPEILQQGFSLKIQIGFFF